MYLKNIPAKFHGSPQSDLKRLHGRLFEEVAPNGRITRTRLVAIGDELKSKI